MNPGELLYRQSNGPLRPLTGLHLSSGRRASFTKNISYNYVNSYLRYNPDVNCSISPLKLSLSSQATCTNWVVADSKGNNLIFEICTPHDIKFTVGMDIFC